MWNLGCSLLLGLRTRPRGTGQEVFECTGATSWLHRCNLGLRGCKPRSLRRKGLLEDSCSFWPQKKAFCTSARRLPIIFAGLTCPRFFGLQQLKASKCLPAEVHHGIATAIARDFFIADEIARHFCGEKQSWRKTYRNRNCIVTAKKRLLESGQE